MLWINLAADFNNQFINRFFTHSLYIGIILIKTSPICFFCGMKYFDFNGFIPIGNRNRGEFLSQCAGER